MFYQKLLDLNSKIRANMINVDQKGLFFEVQFPCWRREKKKQRRCQTMLSHISSLNWTFLHWRKQKSFIQRTKMLDSFLWDCFTVPLPSKYSTDWSWNMQARAWACAVRYDVLPTDAEGRHGNQAAPRAGPWLMGRGWSITLPRGKKPDVVTACFCHRGTEMERNSAEEPAQAYLTMTRMHTEQK